MCDKKCPSAKNAQTSTEFELQEFQDKVPDMISNLRSIAQTAADLANQLEAQISKFTSSMQEDRE